jgi:hypothetical protein
VHANRQIHAPHDDTLALADRTIGVGLIVPDGQHHTVTEPSAADWLFALPGCCGCSCEDAVSTFRHAANAALARIRFLQVDAVNLQLISAGSVAPMLSR